jgi:cyclase
MFRSTLVALVTAPLFATSPPRTAHSSPVQIAERVFVILHPDATEEWPESNTIVIVGDSAALVVDSGYLPSTARSDITAIRTLTNVPVRFLVNTHWHYDHNNGNAEYRRAFSGLQIVSHVETRRIMDVMGPGYGRLVTDTSAASVKTLRQLRARLASGRDSGGGALSPEARRALAENVARREAEQRDMTSFVYAGPTITFDRSMEIELGGRTVTVGNFGRGNTPGDAYVWLARERVLAAGDLLVAPVPYAFNSYPAQWIRALEGLKGLRPNIIVPGHGPVMHDETFLDSVLALLTSAVDQAEAVARQRIAPEDAAVKRIDLEPFRTRFAGTDRGRNEWFDQLVAVLPLRALREARGIN